MVKIIKTESENSLVVLAQSEGYVVDCAKSKEGQEK